MIQQFFSKEQLKKFNCVNCISYNICSKCDSNKNICNKFSPTEDILYNKLYELYKINQGCAELYTSLH